MPLVVAVEEANVAGGFTKVNANVALIKTSEGKIIFFYLLILCNHALFVRTMRACVYYQEWL